MQAGNEIAESAATVIAAKLPGGEPHDGDCDGGPMAKHGRK